MSRLTDEIGDMIRADKIETEAAMRLMLLAQSETIERLDGLETAVNAVTKQQEMFPSLTWLWAFNRRSVVLVVLAVLMLYTLALSPWYVMEIRAALLHAAGLPDLPLP